MAVAQETFEALILGSLVTPVVWLMVLPAMNPVPLTVTLVPTLPLVGESWRLSFGQDAQVLHRAGTGQAPGLSWPPGLDSRGPVSS